jgi:hypothetical protein
MDDLKEMAKAPLELFSAFIAEARSIMAEKSVLPATALEKFQQAREGFGHETEKLLKTFRQRIIEREGDLRAILYPAKLDLPTQAREAIATLSQVTHRLAVRHEQGRNGGSSGATEAATNGGTPEQRDLGTRNGEGEVAASRAPMVEDLVEEGLKALDKMSRAIAGFFWTERLLRSWEQQPAPAILAEYQEALDKGETDTIAIFEAEAERFLARKEDPEALTTFLSLKARPTDARMTPAQRQAKAALEEVRQIREEAALSICLLASVSKCHANLIPLCTQWRQEARHRVDPRTQHGIALALRKDPEPPLPATFVEWSNSGLRAQCLRKFSPGTVVGLSLSLPRLKQQAIASKAEVRWHQEHPNQPGRFMLGLRILENDQVQWSEFLAKVPAQPTERAAW